MRTAIHQFVPMLHRDDAVGRHTLRIRDVLQQRGIRSNVYVEMIDPETAADTKLFPTYDVDAERGDLLLYQFATASSHRPLAGRPPGDAGRQLPQRHPARALRRLEQPDGPPPAQGRPGAHAPGPPYHAGHRRLPVQRGRAHAARLRPYRRGPPGRHGTDDEGHRPTPPTPSRHRDRRQRRGRAGSVSAGSPPTRASSSRSWPCS